MLILHYFIFACNYLGERKSTVVFAVDIAHLESLAETFRKYGYDARGLSSKTNDDERARMLKDFKNQKFPVIVNCGILTEGTGKVLSWSHVTFLP